MLWGTLILGLSAQPNLPQPGPLADLPNGDKIEHLAEYLVFGILLAVGVAHAPDPAFRGRWGLIAVIIGVGYAALDETFQSFVPGRHSDPLDLLTDAIAVVLAQVVVHQLDGGSSEPKARSTDATRTIAAKKV